MKKVFLENLPKTNNSRVDWSNSVGEYIDFEYEDISGEFKICNYENRILTIEYLNNCYKISTQNLRKCALGNILGLKTKEFKYKVGDVFIDEKRNIIINDREYRNKEDNYERNCVVAQKWYKYTCNKCSWTEGWIEESKIKRGNGCSCCAGKTAVLGINTIWDTDKWMVDLGVSEEDAKRYTSRSGEKIIVTCPDCGKVKHKKISDIYYYKSIGCNCGDGVSYPEKFMYSILKQLNIEFETQYSPDYLIPPEGKRYRKYSDFYLFDYGLVIETDGKLGHKGGIAHSKSDKTLEECVEIDKWKDEQHRLHGVETIRIDCYKSDMGYIKNSILNSKLNKLFNLSNIDWIQADLYAIKNNKVKEVCDYWNENTLVKSFDNIARDLNIHRTTLRRYLKLGSKLKWCEYDVIDSKRNACSKNGKKLSEFNKKKIIAYKDGEIIGEYESASFLSKNSLDILGVNLIQECISKVCLGQQNQHKGYVFEYAY